MDFININIIYDIININIIFDIINKDIDTCHHKTILILIKNFSHHWKLPFLIIFNILVLLMYSFYTKYFYQSHCGYNILCYEDFVTVYKNKILFFFFFIISNKNLKNILYTIFIYITNNLQIYLYIINI